jgi:uncharacterized protein YutE (UPF0331/DUF86 family)
MVADAEIPGSYAEAFDLIEKAGIVDSALGEDLKRMARFRNRIAHFYGEIDLHVVYRTLQDDLGDFDRYLIDIEQYLGRTRKRPAASQRALSEADQIFVLASWA